MIRPFMIAMLTIVLCGCADRQSVAAHQMPAPYPSHVAEADPSSSFYRQTALGSVTGTSQFSWFLPRPNRTVFRSRFDHALRQSGLAAPNRDLARYVVNFDFDHVEGPVFGSHMEAALVGRMRIIDRLTGQIVADEPVSARKEAWWPGVMESDWADGRVLETLNILPFFFDSPWFSVGARSDTVYPSFSGPEWLPLIPIRMRDSDGRLVHGEDGRVYGSRSGADRAWQLNAAVSDALAAAFLMALADRGEVNISKVLPCGGGTAARRLQQEMRLRHERFVTLPCPQAPWNVPIGAEALARRI
jgi:hypothetical protein